MTSAPIPPAPQPLDLDAALAAELTVTADKERAVDHLLERYQKRALLALMWASRYDLLHEHAGHLIQRERMRVNRERHAPDGLLPYTPGPRAIGAHNPVDDRYGMPAPYLDKFIRELTDADIRRVIWGYQRDSAKLASKASAWQQTLDLLVQHEGESLADLEKAGIQLPEGI